MRLLLVKRTPAVIAPFTLASCSASKTVCSLLATHFDFNLSCCNLDLDSQILKSQNFVCTVYFQNFPQPSGIPEFRT